MLRRRNAFQEKYDRFLSELRNEIISGIIGPGEFILPENTLSEKYEISRVSVRRALAELVDEGLIEKMAGRGNRVKLPGDARPVETLKIAWFSTSYEIGIVRKILRNYEEAHPLVKLELMLLPEVEYAANLAKLIERGEGPDVFMISDHHFRQLIDLNKLDLLSGYVPGHLKPERDSYPQVFEMFAYEGKMVAAPFVFSPVMICYNRSIFREFGIPEDGPVRNWDDLLGVALRCTRDVSADGTVGQYGFCFSASANRWPVFVLQNGGALMLADRSRSSFADERNVQALEFCVGLMYKHRVSPIFSHGSNHLAERLFVKQRAAMILTTYYFMNEFRDYPIEWDILPVPQHRAAGTLLLGGALAVNRASGKQQLAQSVVDYMTGREAQTLLKKHGCTIPMRREVAEDDGLLDRRIHPPHYKRFVEVLPYARPLRDLNLRQGEVDLLQDELTLLWANMETPQHACERIGTLLNERLAAAGSR